MAKSVVPPFPLGPSTSQSSPPSICRPLQKQHPRSHSTQMDNPQCSANSHRPLEVAENRPKMAAKMNSVNLGPLHSPFLFIFLFLSALPSIWAMPRPTDSPAPGQVPVGGIFTLDKEQGALEVQKVPGWLKAGSGQLFGIAQRKDVGKHQIQLNGRNVPIEVVEDQKSICGPESSTIWLEIVDPRRRISQLSIEEQFKSAQTLLGTLKEVGVRQQDLRLFPFSYLDEYRKVNEKIHELEEEAQTAKAHDQLVFLLNISCGELTEQASEIINAVAENGLDFQVVQGNLRKAAQQKEKSAANSPTTQKPMDNLNEAAGGNSSTTSALLVSAILLIILLALVGGLVLYWLRNKQARKRQKQANSEANGKGSTRPGVLTGNEGAAAKNASALSPDASVGTVTTPMLPAEDGEKS